MEQLRTQAGSKLVAADDAIRSSEQELGFAEASYGEKSVATFRQDIDQAKEHMRASFQLQHQLDDEIPDTEAEQRAWLKEIIQRSEAVGASLAAHKKEFDSLRDLENQVPEALERLEARLPEARSRVQDSESAITALHGQYAESALAEVADNEAQARERLEFVETALAKSRSAWEAQDRSTAALAVRAAEEALSQVDTLTEAVGKAEGSLRAMLGNLQTGLAQSEQDVAEAEALVANGSHPELAGPVAGMKTAVNAVRQALAAGRPDPLELLHQLEAAHRQLNTPLPASATLASRPARPPRCSPPRSPRHRRRSTARPTSSAPDAVPWARRPGPGSRRPTTRCVRRSASAAPTPWPPSSRRSAPPSWPSARASWPARTSRASATAQAWAAGTARARAPEWAAASAVASAARCSAAS